MMDILVSFGSGRSEIETTVWIPWSSFSFCEIMIDKKMFKRFKSLRLLTGCTGVTSS